MISARWSEIRAVFEDAIELPEAEREPFLLRRCGDDRALHEAARRMLRAHGSTASPLDGPAPRLEDFVATSPDAADPRLDGVDPYRTLRMLGRGGMGVVYLAERADGRYERQVALKLIAAGFDSPEVERRFERERRILASLEHPNIARLYDAGVADDGRPFLVLEYVEGRPIDAHCDERGLGVRERVSLFTQVCDAVDHAHGRLILHRDLKPSNILVSDGGEVKLLDFGIARLVSPEEGDAPTRTGGRVMTPEYAAPEQIRGELLSAGSDVYSLAIVLYELLTGRRPLADRTAAVARAWGDPSVRIPTPSDAVSRPPEEREGRDGGEGSAPAATGSTTGPRMASTTRERLERTLRGDLDRILMKALSDDPAARYPSVGDFADDLRRYLEGLPVRARPTSFAYRARKFLRRNAAASAATALAVASLATGALVALSQAERAREERDTAIAVSAFLEDLFRAPDPRAGVVADTTPIVEVLAGATDRLREGFGDQPRTRARLLLVLGSVHRNLSRADLAIPLLTEAVRANRDVFGPGHPDEIEGRRLLGLSLIETGQGDEGLATLDSALALERARAGDSSMEAVRLREAIGRGLLTLQRSEEALPHLEAALAGTRTADPPAPERLASALNTLGSAYGQLGRWEEASPHLAEAASIFGSLDAGRGSDEGMVRGNLAFAFLQLGRFGEAEEQMRRSLELLEASLPSDHLELARMRIRYGDVLNARWRETGEAALAEAADSAYQTGLSALREAPEGPTHLPFALNSYARGLRSWGRTAEAERAFREGVRWAEGTLGPDHPLTLSGIGDLGRAVAESGRPAEALALTGRALEGMEGFPQAAPIRINATLNHARVLLALGRDEGAIDLLEGARPEVASALAADHPLLGAIDQLLEEARGG